MNINQSLVTVESIQGTSLLLDAFLSANREKNIQIELLNTVQLEIAPEPNFNDSDKVFYFDPYNAGIPDFITWQRVNTIVNAYRGNFEQARNTFLIRIKLS